MCIVAGQINASGTRLIFERHVASSAVGGRLPAN